MVFSGGALWWRWVSLLSWARALVGLVGLVRPWAPTRGTAWGDKLDDPMAMYLNDIFTIPANLGGVPAISVPCGLDAKGLPIGLQLTAKALDEPTLFRAAAALESDLALDLRPPLLSGV